MQKGKKPLLFFIIICLLSSCFCGMNFINNVSAIGTTQTNLTFDGLENPQNNFIYMDDYNIVASDRIVFVYDNTFAETPLRSFNVTPYISTGTTWTFGTTKIIQHNETNIYIVTNERYFASAGSMAYYLFIFDYNVITGNFTQTNLNSPVTGYYTLNYGIDKLMLVKLANGYIYAMISGTSSNTGTNTQTMFYRLSPTMAYIGVKDSTTGAGWAKYYVGFGGFYIQDESNSGQFYLITRYSLTTFGIFRVNPETPSTIALIHSWSEDSITYTEDYYTFLINSAYELFNTGNYSIVFTSTMKNATYSNLLVFHYVVFDSASFKSVMTTYIDFPNAKTPIRPVASYPLSGITESFVGITSLVAVDGDGNFRHIDLSLFYNGYQILNGVTNYNIAQIQCNVAITGTTCGWTYINYPLFEFRTSSNIGGMQLFGSNVMFMIDYLNGYLNTQNGVLSIEGVATNILVRSLNGDFTCYKTSNPDYYVAFMQPTKDILGRFESKWFENSMWFGDNRLNSTVGWYDIKVSPVSESAYTTTYSGTLLGLNSIITENLNPAYDGNFSFAFQANQPTNNYYYQMVSITGTYQVDIDGNTAYISKTSFVFVIVSKVGITTLPSGLPDDYDSEDSGSVSPTPSTTDDGGLGYIPNTQITVMSFTNFMIQFFAIVVPSLVLAFYAGKHKVNPLMAFIAGVSIMSAIGFATGLVSIMMLFVVVVIDIVIGIFLIEKSRSNP